MSKGEGEDDLASKHEVYTQKIRDDQAFEKEEQWLEECQDMYLQIELWENIFWKAKQVCPVRLNVSRSVEQPEIVSGNKGNEEQRNNEQHDENVTDGHN